VAAAKSEEAGLARRGRERDNTILKFWFLALRIELNWGNVGSYIAADSR
jgi:hypothetical protein